MITPLSPTEELVKQLAYFASGIGMFYFVGRMFDLNLRAFNYITFTIGWWLWSIISIFLRD